MKMVEMPVSDANDLDEVVRELGLEGSHTTPAEAARELFAAIEAKDAEIASLRAEITYAKTYRKLADDMSAANLKLRIAARQDTEEKARLRLAVELALPIVERHAALTLMLVSKELEAIDAVLACRPQALRCKVTGNPCGTDTWPVGLQCGCGNCQAWLACRPQGEKS